MALARASRSSFSSLRSNCGGGKKTAACGPRQAAFVLPQFFGALAAHAETPTPVRRAPDPTADPRSRQGVNDRASRHAHDLVVRRPWRRPPRAPPRASGRRSPPTRTASPPAIGVARLVRARHSAPRTLTVPSGSTSAAAAPFSPIIDSRPMVGVEKRARTMPAMPATMNSGTPRRTSRTVHQGTTIAVVEAKRAERRARPRRSLSTRAARPSGRRWRSRRSPTTSSASPAGGWAARRARRARARRAPRRRRRRRRRRR